MTHPNESRPAEANHEAAKSLAGDFLQDTAEAAASAAFTLGTRRRMWARALIERQTPNRPAYGSTEWLCLDDEHPDKIAACVVAAELWARDGETLEADLHHEIAAARLAHQQLDEEEVYGEQVKAHREWAKTLQSARPSFTERRRAQLEASAPRPSDFVGRGDGA